MKSITITNNSVVKIQNLIVNHNLWSWNLNRLTEAMIKHIKLGKSKGAGSIQGFVIGGDENRLQELLYKQE